MHSIKVLAGCMALFCGGSAVRADTFEVAHKDYIVCEREHPSPNQQINRCRSNAWLVNTTTSQWYECGATRNESVTNNTVDSDLMGGGCTQRARPSTDAGPYSYGILTTQEAIKTTLGTAFWVVKKNAPEITVCFNSPVFKNAEKCARLKSP